MLDTLEDFYFIYLYIIWKSINIPIFILFYFILFYFNIYIYIYYYTFFFYGSEVIYFYPYLVLITLVFLSRTLILHMYLNMLLTKKKNVWIDSRSDKSKSKSFLTTLLDVCNLATCDLKILLFYVLNIRYLSFNLL